MGVKYRLKFLIIKKNSRTRHGKQHFFTRAVCQFSQKTKYKESSHTYSDQNILFPFKRITLAQNRTMAECLRAFESKQYVSVSAAVT